MRDSIHPEQKQPSFTCTTCGATADFLVGAYQSDATISNERCPNCAYQTNQTTTSAKEDVFTTKYAGFGLKIKKG